MHVVVMPLLMPGARTASLLVRVQLKGVSHGT